MSESAIVAPATLIGDLVLPTGWRIGEASMMRLHRLLLAVPSHVAGVVAPRRQLVAGGTFRTLSERRSLAVRSAVTERPAGMVDGAVLVRPGAAARPVANAVEVERGTLLVDHGTSAHDPDAVPTELLSATVLARSPFPWRPVVLLLAVDGLVHAEVARRLTNELVDAGVEAGLAVPDQLDGPWLARPCAATRRSVEALRPDVVITLDDGARRSVDEWCGDDRGTVVIDLDHGAAEPLSLVPWTIGRAQGRLRARISADVDAVALAELASRLGAGPHPVAPAPPPADTAWVAVPPPRPARGLRPTTLRTISVVSGVLDDEAAARVDALRVFVRRRGHRLTVESSDTVSNGAVEADLLLAHAAPLTDRLRAALAERRVTRRPSVIDVAARDLTLDAPGPRWAELTDEGRALIEAADGALTPSVSVRRSLLAAGVRAHRFPTPRTLSPGPPDRDGGTVAARRFGWDLGGRPHPEPADLAGVAAAVAAVLDDQPGLELEIVGDATVLPGDLTERARVRTVTQPERAAWLMQLWTPWLPYAEAADALGPIVDAGRCGIATILDAANPAVARGLAEPETTVADRGERSQWAAALAWLLAEPVERQAAGRRAAGRAELAFSSAAATAAVDELLAWAWQPEGRP